MRALLSVTDKGGIGALAAGLTSLGFEVVSTGGTAKKIKDQPGSAIPVTEVADLTGFPECLGGRLKTLHPIVMGGILARNTTEDQVDVAEHGLAEFALVVCNLYDFAGAVAKGLGDDETIEQIDIGGPTMIRAAAKNWRRVTVVVDPIDYDMVLRHLRDNGRVPDHLRRSLAGKAFRMTAAYDAAINAWWSKSTSR
jgi:phosphoribosylaminoimidazolecarboxamide formyltransferase / IMP cyclohydrolase